MIARCEVVRKDLYIASCRIQAIERLECSREEDIPRRIVSICEVRALKVSIGDPQGKADFKGKLLRQTHIIPPHLAFEDRSEIVK